MHTIEQGDMTKDLALHRRPRTLPVVPQIKMPAKFCPCLR